MIPTFAGTFKEASLDARREEYYAKMHEKRFSKLNSIGEEERVKIVEAIRDHVSKISSIAFSYIHGSFAEGESFRDIDVALYARSPAKELEMESDLSYALTEKTGYQVEVRIINDGPVSYQMAVLRKGKLLSCTCEETIANYIEDTSRRYREYIHLRNLVLEA